MEREMALNKIHAKRGGPLADNARAATLIMFDSNRNILFKKEFDDIEQSSLMYTSSTIAKWKILTIKWLWLVIIWLYFDDETINIAIFILGITIL